ncbi:MFS transporter [uncultured Oscillibacter sp.]|uniref:MFS transporter n=1 Tax=uncultured Oscillibacter sp. TaxID=876091 RepID=UPI00216F0617|nr:MFS transporter [uncultured Oscillibacter sp.]MCI9011379.1 MFS transporter [Oscillibacter sp.]
MKTSQAPLFRRDFTLVVLGQIISLFGNAILRFALPLYLLRQTESPALFGAVGAAAFIPAVLCAPIGGVVADRVNKRNIMVVLDFSTAGLILLFTLLLDRAPLVPLMVASLMLLYGIAGAYQPSVQASIPLLARPEQLTSANAVINMVQTLSALLGPVIGGVLFGTFGLRPILWVGMACFFLSAVMELFIRIPHSPRAAAGGVLSTVRRDLGESWRFIRRERPVFLSVMLVLALFNLVLSAALVVGIPVAVVQTLGMSDSRLGLTQGAMGLGGLFGGVLAALLGPRLRLRRGGAVLLAASLTAAGMGAALLPGVPPSLGWWGVTAMSFAIMVLSTLLVVVLSAAVQGQTPPELLGKVMAFIMAVSNCAAPLGQAVYGALFEACPAWAVLLGAAGAAALAAAWSRGVFRDLDGI